MTSEMIFFGLQVMTEMGAPYSEMEVASFMSCSKGYMGECGMRWACFDVQRGYSNWSFLVFISCGFLSGVGTPRW